MKKFAKIIDSIFLRLDLTSKDIIEDFNVPKSTFAHDRSNYMSINRMRKYGKFIEVHNISKDFFLTGEGPMLVGDPEGTVMSEDSAEYVRNKRILRQLGELDVKIDYMDELISELRDKQKEMKDKRNHLLDMTSDNL